MKTAVVFIFVFLAVAAGGFFLNKKLSKDNLLIAPNINNFEIKNKLNDDGSVSSLGESFNSDNINKINMKLTSSAFENNQYIPPKYTCDEANVNPPFSISDVPKEAESLVLIVDDPDAPKGDWVHWIVFNIQPGTKEIKESGVPAGSVQGKTDFRNPGYGGPCPPSGIHHYQFKLYALDIIFSLDASAGKKEIEKAMEGHILAEDLLVGLYKRK